MDGTPTARWTAPDLLALHTTLWTPPSSSAAELKKRGQCQRIGIARALYKGANVLIFDEATSALDDKTEQAVMEAIEGLGRELTILIIAHRLTTLKACDQVIELSNNGVLQSGSFQDVVIKKS